MPGRSTAIAHHRRPSPGNTSANSSDDRGVWCSNTTGRPSPASARCTCPNGTST